MNEQPKFCRDCLHYHPGTPSSCRAPENTEINLVTGEEIFPRYSAAANRSFDTAGCSKEGKWWKPKKQEA